MLTISNYEPPLLRCCILLPNHCSAILSHIFNGSFSLSLSVSGWSGQWWSAQPSAVVFPDWRKASASSAEKRRTPCRRLARAPRWVCASAGINSDITVGTVPTCPTIRSSVTWWLWVRRIVLSPRAHGIYCTPR